MKSSLKVALVCDSLVQIGGAEKTLKVLAEMYPDAPIFTSVVNKDVMQSFLPFSRIQTSSLQKLPSWLRMRYKWLLPFLPVAFESFDFKGFDLVISSSSSFAKGIITPTNTKHVSYCHTPTRFLWDSYHSYLKSQKLPFGINFLVKKMLHSLRIWDRSAAERVDIFIANSHNTSDRIHKFYRKESYIIPPPIAVEEIEQKDAHADFFLVVSRLEPYKNVDLVVKAFNQLPNRKLYIIGDGSQRKMLESIAGPNVHILGFKNEEVVREYYQNCRVFIAPSRDEDFGMTAIEAMAAGKPVLAIREGGYKETVIEGKNGIFYDEHHPKSILEGLIQILDLSWDHDAIRSYAETFSRTSFEEKIRHIIEQTNEV